MINAACALVNALVILKTERGPGSAAWALRFMCVPDTLSNGLQAAERAKILQYVGGPEGQDLERLRKQSSLGVAITLTIPSGGNGRGVRAFVRLAAPLALRPGEC